MTNLKEKANQTKIKETKPKFEETNYWLNIWLQLRDEVLPARLQEPVDQCLLFSIYLSANFHWDMESLFYLTHTGMYNDQ